MRRKRNSKKENRHIFYLLSLKLARSFEKRKMEQKEVVIKELKKIQAVILDMEINQFGKVYLF